MKNKLISLTLLATGALFALPASASLKWTMNTGTNCGDFTCVSSNFGNTRTYTASDGTKVTASAWANTGDASGNSNVVIQNAYLSVYSGGLGVVNRDYNSGDTNEGNSPEHAMDNDQRFDSIMFSFSTAVALTQIDIGWYSTDSDISILYYSGTGVPPLAGLTYSQLLSNNWKVLSNIADAAPTETINPTGISSSYWLIGAYNSAFGSLSGSNTYNGSDYVKLLALYATKPSSGGGVPEPGTLLLLGAGALGLIRMRRS